MVNDDMVNEKPGNRVGMPELIKYYSSFTIQHLPFTIYDLQLSKL